MLYAGIDEAGRGPLAGPVFAAAVILDDKNKIAGLRDSKKISAKKRDELASIIKEKALIWCVASASVDEIDSLNILQATMLAMTRAYQGLDIKPDMVLIDGNRIPEGINDCATKAIIKGDDSHECIAAASILAKTFRDNYCLDLHTQFPMYGFDQHKGYGTKLHLDMIKQYGPCAQHRKSFAPIKNYIPQLNDDVNNP